MPIIGLDRGRFVPVTFAGGDLVVPAPAMVGAMPASCLYKTSDTYHLACDAISVRVREVAPAAVGLQTVVYFGQAGSDERACSCFSRTTASVSSPTACASTRWIFLTMRARRAPGACGPPDASSIYFDTWDGAQWTTRAGGRTSAVLDKGQISLGITLYAGTPPPARRLGSIGMTSR